MSSHEIPCTVGLVDNTNQDDDAAQPLANLVGSNVRELRQELGLTLSQVATELRSLGANWSTGWVGDIAAGRGKPSVEVVLLLSLALTQASEEHIISPQALLDAEGPVALTPKAVLKPESFNRLVSEGLSDLTLGDTVDGAERLQTAVGSASEIMGTVQRISGAPLTIGQYSTLYSSIGLSDQRAAKKLGLSEAEYLGWCRKLWGHVMSVEVAKRAPADATPQKKGRITRELLAELRTAIGAGHGHDS